MRGLVAEVERLRADGPCNAGRFNMQQGEVMDELVERLERAIATLREVSVDDVSIGYAKHLRSKAEGVDGLSYVREMNRG